MRSGLVAIIKNYIPKLSKNSAQESTSPQLPYHSLSPMDNADSERHYSNALLWAIKNCKKEDIKNIALTGPYGSGKSSILKTFQAEHQNKEMQFLNISLGTFKEEIDGTSTNNTSNDLLRLIELSLLQQIFYHEEDDKIPDSRFKKIKSVGQWKLTFLSIGIFIFLISLLITLKPDILNELLGISLDKNKTIYKAIKYISLGICAISTFSLILKSIRSITGITIEKLNIQDAEIQINKEINKSILNNHLDEILYFFEVTKYNIVVIEDLDRFQQTEIFTKLREINFLINNSKKVKRNIVFIYAVRDEMFQDKDRTKFFDFIIPVIPVVNSSNSNDILTNIINKNEYKISDALVEDISLFIDDMRLLYNTINEYHIYSINLDKKLDQDKLLAIIVFKNIYPNEFVKLSNNEGVLYEVLHQKESYKKEKIKDIDTKIEAIRKEIRDIEQSAIQSIEELQSIYLYRYLAKTPNFVNFIINNTEYNFGSMLKDGLFEYFTKDQVKYISYYNRYNNNLSLNTSQFSFNFLEVEKEVDPRYKYLEKKQQIEDRINNKTSVLKQQIDQLREEKLQTSKLQIKDLLADREIPLASEIPKQKLLITLLIRSGYIGEDYIDYISIFYPGSITKEDRQFLLHIKSRVALEFGYQINKIEKLISKIEKSDFEKEYILNIYLLDFILRKNIYNDEKKSILSIISKETERSMSFLSFYITNGTNIALFIKELCKAWPNFCNFILNSPDYSDVKPHEYIELILKHADLSDLVIFSKNSELKSWIEKHYDAIINSCDEDKTTAIATKLEIKFDTINLTESSENIGNLIISKNLYKITYHNLKEALTFKRINTSEFDKKNYHTITNSHIAKLIEYLHNDFSIYIKDVYMQLPPPYEEPEGSLLFILNNNKITLNEKDQIIKNTSTKISDISQSNGNDVNDALFEHLKVVPNWCNVYYYLYNIDYAINEPFISFINNTDNTIALSKQSISDEYINDDLEELEKTINLLVFEDRISDECYSILIPTLNPTINSLNKFNLSQWKISFLIDNRFIKLNQENYEALKNNWPGLDYRLLEKNADQIAQTENIKLEEQAINEILKSNSIDNNIKNTIINKTETDTIYSSQNTMTLLAHLCIADKNFSIDISTLKHLIINITSKKVSFKLFIEKLTLFNIPDIHEILNSLSMPYPDINVNGKSLLLDPSAENLKLLTLLQEMKYIKKFQFDKKGYRIARINHGI